MLKTLIFCFLCLGSTLSMQAQCFSMVVGRVFNEQFQALPHAIIRIQENQHWTQSDSSGQFIFPNLQPRLYTFQVQCKGYENQQKALVISPGNPTGLTFILSPSPDFHPPKKKKTKP